MKSKNSIKINIRLILTQRALIASVLFLAASAGLIFILFFGNNKDAKAAVTGDIRSIASGNWNNTAIWQRFNGSTWVAYGTVPSFSDKMVTIQNGHTVTITAALSADDVVIEAGGVLALNSGITLTLKKSTIPDMKVYGIFKNAGTVTITAGTNITYYSGGSYQHNYTITAGTIPVGVWNTGSNCEIVGYTINTSIPSGLNQTFDNVKWNCPSQTLSVNFAGGLTTLNGNFIVSSTGTSQLLMANNTYTLNLNGNLVINGGTIVWNNTSNKTINLNINGDFIVSGGTMNFITASGDIGNVNVTGNYTQSNGTVNFSQGSGSSAVLNISGDFSVSGGNLNLTTANNNTGNISLTGNYSQTGGVINLGQGNNSPATFNVSGNFTHVGGTLSTTGTGTTAGQIIFDNIGSQNFTSSGNTVTGNIDYTVNSGSTLNMGTNQVLGRNFTLASGGELGIGSFDGISASGSVGNIGVSGTRSFNAGGYYLYNGAGNQNTGNGLPAAINKLTINNGNYLTLTNTVSVSSNLDLINGKILTGTNELKVTSTSVSAITNYSDNSFVVGNLRRSTSGSGSYDFPVGSFIEYELMTVTLSGTSITNLLGTFVYAVTNDTLYPLNASVNGVPMTEMLDYGYWTLSQTGSIGAGTYAVDLYEQGFSNMISNSCTYGVLVRNNASSFWQALGNHTEMTQTSTTNIVGSNSNYTSFYQYGIALGDYPTFSSPALISGVAGNVGAVYLYQQVIRGVDAHISITRIYNGASLSDIDNSSVGYNESFQPFVNFPANKDSYIEWDVKFKKANTYTDTTLQKITATGVDVDGDNTIREYIVATMPTSYSLDAATSLTMSNDSGRYKAIGPTASVANIDTSHHELMYQLNYNNVNHLLYRTGSINSGGSLQTRQTSLFFKSFLTGAPKIALPIELVEFKAKLQNGKVMLNWITASEINNDFFTIERSKDGENFTKLFTKRGAGNSSTVKYYELTDEYPLTGISYYRLKQTDYDGKFSYSKTEAVDNSKSHSDEDIDVRYLTPNPFDSDFRIVFKMKSKGIVNISLMNAEGKVVETKKINAVEGDNDCLFEGNTSMSTGVYFLVFQFNDVRVTKKIVRN